MPTTAPGKHRAAVAAPSGPGLLARGFALSPRATPGPELWHGPLAWPGSPCSPITAQPVPWGPAEQIISMLFAINFYVLEDCGHISSGPHRPRLNPVLPILSHRLQFPDLGPSSLSWEPPPCSVPSPGRSSPAAPPAARGWMRPGSAGGAACGASQACVRRLAAEAGLSRVPSRGCRRRARHRAPRVRLQLGREGSHFIHPQLDCQQTSWGSAFINEIHAAMTAPFAKRLLTGDPAQCS